MKKKGLIISTVVMVVVLIASLTTATYAWFTVSNKTTISGFDLQVVAGNALNIGLKSDLAAGYNPGDAPSAFVTGTCTYTAPTAGTLTGGKWEGDPGLGATLDHQIMFGEMSKAVGFTSETTATNATPTNTGLIDGTNPNVTGGSKITWNSVIKANQGKSKDSLAAQEMATANGNISTSTQGDYAYLWLGISPAKELQSAAKLHIYVQSVGGGNNLGIASAVHVAHKVNGATDWTDVDVFGDNTYATAKSSAKHTMEVDASDTFTGGSKNQTLDGMANVTLQLTKKTVGEIDQVQLVIYLAGADTDCIDSAKGVNAIIGLYFEAEEKETEKSATPTAASIDQNGKLTMTGIGAGTKVEYSINNGTTWVEIKGTWEDKVFTVDKVAETLKGATVKIRQTAVGKAASEAFDVTNNYNA